MMTTLVLISFLVGVASVSYNTIWKKAQLNLATEDLATKLQMYRMKAILENRTYEMKIQEKTFLYYRKREQDAWAPWQHFQLDERIQYSMKGSMRFTGNGFTTPSKSIELTFGEYHKKLIINFNGRFRQGEIY